MAAPSNRLLSVQNPKSLAGMWIFTVLWCGISFTVFWAFAIASRQTGGAIVGGLFSLLGLVMLFGSVKATLEYLKFGRVHLALEGEQPAAGRSFSARLDLPGEAGAAATIHAELVCVQTTWSRGSKGGPSKSERDAWTRKNVFPVRRGPVSGYAMLKFDVPADQPASDLPGEGPPDAMLEVGHPAGIEIGRSYYRWELRVKADVPGIDLERTFKLRVAAGPQGAGPRPAGAAPRLDPKFGAELERRVEARQEQDRRLGMWCAFIGFAPIVAPFAIMGLAVGLAGCPMGWNASAPPRCEFAGINWGPVMTGAFDLMFVAVPAGIALSSVVYFAGRVLLDRRHGTSSFGGQGGLAIGLVVLGFFLYQAWQFARPARTARLVSSPTTQPPAARADASKAGRAEPGQDARGAAAAGQEDDESRLKTTLASIEKESGPDHPAAGRVHFRLSLVYERHKQFAEQEQALLAALEVLEKHPAAAVRKALGAEGGTLDKEIVARRLGDFYWDRRRYDRAYVHYEKAYRYTGEIPLSDFERNRRLARNSAGRMAGACTQGDWDVADRAMKELKERMANVDAETRKQLEYWVRTGEPRLAARKC